MVADPKTIPEWVARLQSAARSLEAQAQAAIDTADMEKSRSLAGKAADEAYAARGDFRGVRNLARAILDILDPLARAFPPAPSTVVPTCTSIAPASMFGLRCECPPGHAGVHVARRAGDGDIVGMYSWSTNPSTAPQQAVSFVTLSRSNTDAEVNAARREFYGAVRVGARTCDRCGQPFTVNNRCACS